MTVAAAAYFCVYAACGCIPVDEPVALPDDAATAVCGDAGPAEFSCCSDAGRGGPACREGAWTCREGETTC
jgi:hypothetical protein